MTSPMPKWIMRRYSVLWRAFAKRNFDFTQAVELLHEQNERLVSVVLSDLKKYGRVKRPMLGLRYINIDDNLQEKMGLPVKYGALVGSNAPHHEGVILGTPAAKAGIKEKDIVLECNGEKLSEEKTIQDFLEVLNVGDILNMKILRDKKPMKFKVVLAERK